MSDVRQWLDSLGLGQYAEAFEENAVDWELLPRLDQDTLKDIGVKAAGHRIRILDAATQTVTSTKPPLQEPPGPGARQPVSTGEAERRQLTVMFCDLVGSTALSESMDPEEYRDVLAAYQSAAARAIGQYDGYVARYMGDGLLVYFGYPQAHEDDAERAVRAALDIVERVAALDQPRGVSLQVRIGIATGLVVVGDIIGEGASEEHAVLGDTPNLAARLQSMAQPNAIVIAESTRRLMHGRFELEELGSRIVKGLKRSVPAFRVHNISFSSRFQTTRESVLVPLLGRDEELAMLLRRWDLAREGEGQVVLLVGEAGIGKSHLIETLLVRVERQSLTVVRYQCSPYHANSPFFPITQQLQMAAGFERQETTERRIEKLETLLSDGLTDDTELTPLLAALLSLPTDKYRNQEQLPERRKDATVAALLRRLKTLTIQSPVLIVLEDAHWLDPSSTEFFGAVIETVHSLPVLLVISHRPEYEPAWRSPGHETRLSLSRLARRDCAEIVEQMAAGKHLPTEVFEQILSKSDGIPLFIEELTKSVLESDALVEKSNDGVSRGTFRQTAVPDTLQDSLMARLDRLGPVKGIAQTAAVIGREFPFDWLSALSPLDDHALSEALTRLEAAGIISRSGTSPESVFVFRHALVRDAAYNSILLAKRRELHAQAALLLESTYPSPVESQPELIAQHYDEAQTPEKAVKYWHLAGERAVERAANLEAVRHLRSALKCIPSLPEGRGRDELELRLLTLLSPAQLVTRSRAATDIATTLGRARDLAEQLDDPERLVPVTLGMWLIRMTRGEIDAAQKLTQELFQQAERTADNGFILQAHHAAWTIPMYTGNFEEVLRHVDSGVALYDRGRHGNHAFLYLGHDPLTCALALRSVALWMLGFVDQALDCVARAVDTALESNHPPTLVHALSYEGYLHFLREEPKDVAVVAKRLSSIAVEQELTPGVIAAECLVGWAMARKGEADEGVERLRRSINAYKATGELLHLPQRLSMLADAMSITDRISDALDINAEAQTVAVSTGERWYEGMILCQRAQLLRRLGNDPHLIEMTLCESMGVARRQNAKSVELRAATELARLWIEQGREQDAYDLLVAVCRSFTEGFDTPNLRDAIGLIGELG